MFEKGQTREELSTPENPHDNFPLYETFYEREDYYWLTPRELIQQTHQFMSHFSKLQSEGRMPDSVVFLDKSARPLSVLFRKLFPIYCPDIHPPQIRFLNYKSNGYDPYEDFNKDRPFTGRADIIKKIYGKHINTKGNILIVDEMSKRGKTREEARQLFHNAFPESCVEAMTAYTKTPKWAHNKYYLGVREYQVEDYEQMAIANLNEERGTSYKNAKDIRGNGRNDWHSFQVKYKSLEGSIPYVLPDREYHFVEKSIKEVLRTRSLKPKKIIDDRYLQARKELDEFVHAVIALKQKKLS